MIFESVEAKEDNGGQIEWWKRLMELFYGRIMGTRKGFRVFIVPIDKG